jgi:sigma-B regulation protein RsbU (phosphoserine phosphatase)
VAARKQWVEIENDCLPLGVAAEEVFPARMLPLGPGDRLVILTDGLTEAFGLSGVEFGTDGIRRTLDRLGPTSPQQLCDGLIAASRAHGPQGDDQSVIVIAIAP